MQLLKKLRTEDSVESSNKWNRHVIPSTLIDLRSLHNTRKFLHFQSLKKKSKKLDFEGMDLGLEGSWTWTPPIQQNGKIVDGNGAVLRTATSRPCGTRCRQRREVALPGPTALFHLRFRLRWFLLRWLKCFSLGWTARSTILESMSLVDKHFMGACSELLLL